LKNASTVLFANVTTQMTDVKNQNKELGVNVINFFGVICATIGVNYDEKKVLKHWPLAPYSQQFIFFAT
jgi:hypothetical protein